MKKSPTAKPWWETVPGILTGIAALITAIGGILAVYLANRPAVKPPDTPPSTAGVAIPGVTGGTGIVSSAGAARSTGSFASTGATGSTGASGSTGGSRPAPKGYKSRTTTTPSDPLS